MPHDDVRQALEAMDDDAVRDRLAAGDFTSTPSLQLTDDEKQLVQDAAADYPEVAGFALNAYRTSLGDPSQATVKIDFATAGLKWKSAADYAFKFFDKQ